MFSANTRELNHRFVEEALALAQPCGATKSEAHQLVDYVYGRPVGEKAQEVGGVMVTLAALCLANGLDMHLAAEVDLVRIWMKIDQIRAKQAAKPKHLLLPAAPSQPETWKVLPSPARATGEALYTLRYSIDGAKWELNMHQGVGNDWAKQLNAFMANGEHACPVIPAFGYVFPRSNGSSIISVDWRYTAPHYTQLNLNRPRFIWTRIWGKTCLR